jgi:hypothetical protein
VTILFLLATPLHDPGPPPRQDVAPAVTADLAVAGPRVALAETATAALPHAVVKRHRAEADPVPAVIYETRRPRHRPRVDTSRTAGRGSAPAVMASASASVATQSP